MKRSSFWVAMLVALLSARFGGRRFGAEPSSRGGRHAGNGYDAALAGVAQLVEHQLPKLRVVGSSPIARFRRDVCAFG